MTTGFRPQHKPAADYYGSNALTSFTVYLLIIIVMNVVADSPCFLALSLQGFKKPFLLLNYLNKTVD